MAQTNKLLTAGYLFLGAGFLAQGVAMLRGVRGLFPNPNGTPEGLGEGLTDAVRRTKGQIQKKTVVRAGSIENRAAMIRRLIRKDSENPEIRNKALAVLTRKCGVDGNRRWCVPRGTLLLCSPGDFVPIESVQTGDVVMGDGGWTRVLNHFETGRKPLLKLTLDNGGALLCTPDHKLFVVPRKKIIRPDGKGSYLVAGDREAAVEVEAGNVRPDDHLLQPDRLPFGEQRINRDLALIMGAYVADGWLEPSRVSIAGIPNNKGVREQVIAAAENLGLRYSTDAHKVRLREPELVKQFEVLGRHAPEKRLAGTGYDEETVLALLSGIEADSHTSHKMPTFSSTSYTLALQYRIFQRMLGRSVSLRINDDVRGPHPVHKVIVRDPSAERSAKVLSVTEAPADDTFDIETDTRRFYLPEQDVIVHNCVPQKNWDAEIRAMFQAVTDPNSPIAVRYVRDHLEKDTFVAANKTMKLRGGDCLPGETLLLTRNGFKPICDIRPGDTVMGDGRWTKVTNWWDKGVLPVRELDLSSGGTLRCTDDHRLFTVPRHLVAGDRNDAVETTAGEVEEGADLLTPEHLELGTRHLDPDDAWLLGVFVADGWVKYDEDRPRMVGISGKDGFPKEEQKRRAQRIAEAKGWRTVWHGRWLDIFPSDDWMELFVACGRRAPNKHLPFIDVDAETAKNLLGGLAADASHDSHGGGLTFATTSETLALQIRLLHRALGIKTSIRRVDDHGGLGKNPIYRIGTTKPETSNGRRISPFVSVREVREPVADEHVYDIEVEGHRFYLPEHDVVVHNCDDMTIYLGALLMSVGYPLKLRIVQARNASTWSHIYLLVGLPPTDPARWVPLDATVNKPAGWEAPDYMIVRRKDFEV